MASSQDMLPPPVTHPSLKHKDIIIQHPNGSDGWLPAENFNPPSPTERPFQRPTISAPPSKRKSAFRGPSRHPSVTVEPRENVNDAPAASSDEDLQNRVVSVNNNLTLKQRSKIAKLEGQSTLLFLQLQTNTLFSERWETYFKDHKGGRKDRETSSGYPHQRA